MCPPHDPNCSVSHQAGFLSVQVQFYPVHSLTKEHDLAAVTYPTLGFDLGGVTKC